MRSMSEFVPEDVRSDGVTPLAEKLASVRPRIRVKAPVLREMPSCGALAPVRAAVAPVVPTPAAVRTQPPPFADAAAGSVRTPSVVHRLVEAETPGEPPMRLPASWLVETTPPRHVDRRFQISGPWRGVLAMVSVLMVAGATVTRLALWEWRPDEPVVSSREAPDRTVTSTSPSTTVEAAVEHRARLDFAPLLQRGRRPSGDADAAPWTPPSGTRSDTTGDDLVAARRAIARGDIVGARAMLDAAADPEAEPDVLMALAETYDPRMLAAWGTRGVAADRSLAKELYERARAAGHPVAVRRLQALE